MKRAAALLAMLLLFATGCQKEPETIVLTGTVEEVNDHCVLISTEDWDHCDRAIVTFDGQMEIPFNLMAGQKLRFTILPTIEQTYPAQVTAIKVVLLKEEQTSSRDDDTRQESSFAQPQEDSGMQEENLADG